MKLGSFKGILASRAAEWMEYCNSAWQSSGCPAELAPMRVYDEPVAYGDDAYRWLETKYQDVFESAFRRARSAIRPIDCAREVGSFWETYFDAWSLWKQLIPLFAFASAFRGPSDNHVEMAAAYIIGQGVPSKAVDDILDKVHAAAREARLVEMTPFCLVSYATALQLIRDVGLAGGGLESTFLANSKIMYTHMWKEFTERFSYPERVSRDQLREYITRDSRLLSSVFFSITIEWAFALAEERLGETGRAACKSFRRVRQLNDEIIDSEEDFTNGIVTYPMLYSLSSPEHGPRMRRLLAAAWRQGHEPETISNRMRIDYRDMMLETSAFVATAHESFNELYKVMQFVMTRFTAQQAFAISLLVNQRMTVLLKRSDNNWGHVADEYDPQFLSRYSGRQEFRHDSTMLMTLFT